MTGGQAHIVAERVRRVLGEIESLAPQRRVTLVAVSKGFGIDHIRWAVGAGCRAIGESYAQEVRVKCAAIADLEPRPEVHFIGQIQRNKVRALSAYVDVWQSVDRAEVAVAIAREAPGARVFLQVNATGEEFKGGVGPQDLEALIDAATSVGLDVAGLMTIGPTSGERAETERCFETVRALAESHGLRELSMGMSGDFDLALSHGATVVRIGSALFGERPPRER